MPDNSSGVCGLTTVAEEMPNRIWWALNSGLRYNDRDRKWASTDLSNTKQLLRIKHDRLGWTTQSNWFVSKYNNQRTSWLPSRLDTFERRATEWMASPRLDLPALMRGLPRHEKNLDRFGPKNFEWPRSCEHVRYKCVSSARKNRVT